MQIESVKIDALSLDPANARKHSKKNLDAIKGSLAKFGQQKPIIVDKNGVVVAGNGTMEAAKSLGWNDINVVRTELTGPDAIAFALADNRTAELAEWDIEPLNKTLQSLKDIDFDLGAIGFDDDFMESHTPKVIKEGLTDEDAIPEQVETRCKPGDLWVLGNHRLLCGDSTNIQHVERLMGGEKADMVFTDPPYNINYVPEDRAKGGRSVNKLGGIENDSMSSDAFVQFLKDVFASANLVLKSGGGIYLCSPIDFESKAYLIAWSDLPWKYQAGLVWAKNNHSISRFDYHPKHELIHYGWKEGAAHVWIGDRSQFSVWDIARDNGGDYKHPTQKPVAIPEKGILNSCKNRGLVLDLFTGSGSTLIACEKTNRKCYGMEIDQKYCDVILKRWEDFTGNKATLES